MCASDYGSPQRRHRVYIIGTLVQSPTFRQDVHSVMASCKVPAPDLEAFLEPADSPLVTEWLTTFRANGCKRQCTRKGWEEAHKHIYAANNQEWPPNLLNSDFMRRVLAKNRLTARESEVVFFLLQDSMAKGTGMVNGVFDLSQSLGRIPAALTTTPTVMPSGLLFYFNQERLLIPPELLRLQGFPWHHPTTEATNQSLESWSFLADLAGNAFSGHCIATAMFAVFLGM